MCIHKRTSTNLSFAGHQQRLIRKWAIPCAHRASKTVVYNDCIVSRMLPPPHSSSSSSYIYYYYNRVYRGSDVDTSSSFFFSSHYMIASSFRIPYQHFTLELVDAGRGPAQANFTTLEFRNSGEHLHFMLELVAAGSGIRIVLNRTLQPPEALEYVQ
jgi:hypothetical protein